MLKIIMQQIILIVVLSSIHLTSFSQTTPVVLRNEGNFIVVEFQASGTFEQIGICWDAGGKPTAESGNKFTTINTSTPGIYRDSMPEGTLTPNTGYTIKSYQFSRGEYRYSNELNVTSKIRIQPSAPVSNLQISAAAKNRILLDWDDDDAGFYVVHDITGANPPDASSIPDGNGVTSPIFRLSAYHLTTNSNITITGLTEGTQYSFIVIPGDNSTGDLNYNLRQDDPASITGFTISTPTTQATNIGIQSDSSVALNVTWTSGNGEARVVMMNSTNSFSTVTDESTYTADASWNNSGEQCIYNGTGTSVKVTNVDLSQQYFFRVYEFNGTTLPAYNSNTATDNPNPTRVWSGGTSTDWTASGNWEGSYTPNSSVHVSIPDLTGINTPAISSSASAGSLVVTDGGSLTINDGGSLSVSGEVIIQGASGSSGIVVKGSGSLTAGSSLYERYIDNSLNWHLLSSPNSNSDVTQLRGIYVNNWNEATADWGYLNSSSTLNVMQGYNVRFGDAAQSVRFTGSFNNGSQSISVTNASPGGTPATATNGWNLVGNPYPSPVDWGAAGWTRTNVNGTAYIWNSSADDYEEFSSSASNLIPPTQGFFVWASASTGSLGMDNDVRTTGTDNFYKKSEFSNFRIKLSNPNREDDLQVFFHPEATDDFDNDYDGYKLFSWSEEVPQVYSITNTNEQQLAINTLNSELLNNLKTPIVIRIGYKNFLNSPLFIEITQKESIGDDITFGLFDKLLNEYQDITNSQYEFSSDIGEFNDRFDLYISKQQNNLEDLSANVLNCYTYNNNLIINLKEPLHNAKILIYDVLGRPIINKSLTTKTQHIFSIPEKTNIFVVNIIQDETFLYRKTLVK
jgi:hypothetical protein